MSDLESAASLFPADPLPDESDFPTHSFTASLMRAPSSSDRRPVGANMTPMIDVVFLLIIFFLVSSHLSRQEHHLPLDLPVAETSGTVDEKVVGLTVSVDANATWMIGGQPSDLAQLRSALAELAQQDGLNASLRIRTDRNVQYQAVEPILREAARAGIADAAISVKKPGRVSPPEATAR